MTVGDRPLEPVRVVVISPSDVATEREIVASVAEELNRRVAPAHGCRLSVWRWETDARPGLHLEGSQGLIDERMDIADADVVVGIFWKRFGTPTGDAASGTEHELRQAWDAWRRHGRPDVMVYFCERKAAPTSRAEAEQWQRVLKFREELPKEQFWWPYLETVDFERLVRGHLEDVVLRRRRERRPSSDATHRPDRIREYDASAGGSSEDPGRLHSRVQPNEDLPTCVQGPAHRHGDPGEIELRARASRVADWWFVAVCETRPDSVWVQQLGRADREGRLSLEAWAFHGKYAVYCVRDDDEATITRLQELQAQAANQQPARLFDLPKGAILVCRGVAA